MRDALLLAFILAALVVALRYPFVGLLTWAWFSLMTPHQMAYGVYGLPLNVIIAAVCFVALGVSGTWRHFRLDRITLLLLLFGVWLTVSQLFSLDATSSAVYYDRFIKLLIFVVLAAQMTDDKLKFHALVWMLVISIGYFAAKGALFTIATLGEFRVQGLERTILEDNNHTGIAIATILPMILYLQQEAKDRLVRIGLLCLFLAAIVAIIGTHSRGAFVSLVVFGGFFWLRSKRKVSILAALVVVMIPAIAFMPSKWSERMETITDAKTDASFMGRVDAWVINTKVALQNPLTGGGLRNPYKKEIAEKYVDPERAARAKAAHSIYFEVLGGTGFVGLAIYLALLGTAFLTALSLHLRRNEVEPWMARFGYYAQMSLVVFGVGGGTVSLEMWDGYLVIIALIAAVSRLQHAAGVRTPVSTSSSPRRFSWRLKGRGRALTPSHKR